MPQLKTKKLPHRKSGFTLTEILIAVAIVGLISAMVLPVFSKNTADETLEKGFEKETKSLEQALSLDANMFYETNLESNTNAEKFMKKYMKISKYCGLDNGDCFAEKYYEYNNNNKSDYTPTYKGSCATLKNGMSICLSSTGSSTVSALVDINGKKGPNILGRDLRELNITYDKNKQQISSNVATVYYTNSNVKTENACNSEIISLDCCKTQTITKTSHTECCVYSVIANEYPDACKNDSLNETPRTKDIDYTITCKSSPYGDMGYEVVCTVDPADKVTMLDISLNVSACYWAYNDRSNKRCVSQSWILNESNRSGDHYYIDGIFNLNSSLYSESDNVIEISQNYCDLVYKALTMDENLWDQQNSASSFSCGGRIVNAPINY